MTTISVDFDVEKALFSRRATADMTFNDVLRELLGLPPKQKPSPGAKQQGAASWRWDVVTLPHGTELRLMHQGREHRAEIVDGRWMLEGVAQNSATAAARAIIKTSAALNGWWKWEARLPGDAEWKWLGHLRDEARQQVAQASAD